MWVEGSCRQQDLGLKELEVNRGDGVSYNPPEKPQSILPQLVEPVGYESFLHVRLSGFVVFFTVDFCLGQVLSLLGLRLSGLVCLPHVLQGLYRLLRSPKTLLKKMPFSPDHEV